MKHERSWLGSGVAALALIAVTPAAAQQVDRPTPHSGRVVSAKGGETVTLVPTNATRRLVVKQNLKAGDVIRTNAKGGVAIVFADRTQIRLARNSVLRVKAVRRGSPSSVRLEKGRVWGRTQRGGGASLSVETPAATAGIRGTEWAISADENQTSLQVYSGEVELFNEQGSLTVGAGQAANAVLGNAPTRVALVNPEGREQMLYYLALEDGLDLFAGETTVGLAEARRSDWAAARAALGSTPGDPSDPVRQFVDFVVAVRSGEDRDLPSIDPDDADSYAVRAYIESFIGDLGQATATVDAGLARHPEASRLYQIKARTALLLGDEKAASAAIACALLQDPQDAGALALKAEVAASYAGKPYEALDTVTTALDLAPGDPRVLSRASTIQLERGAGREALRSIDQALAVDPGNAAFHAQRATVLLELGRVDAARHSLDRALEIDPSLSIVRTSLAQYHMLKGQPEIALEEALAASADNPSYGRALLQLAEVSYLLGDVEPSIQQLDTADRLDPASPFTPLARTAIALHRFDGDGAIQGASEALARYRARGGDYANLSENRATGSLVSQAFRFLGMEARGRYYADRVFDSFTPSSYFDQALNQTPGPFVIRDADGSFDTSSAEDLDQLSSFLQGIALDPLSVANSERKLLFGNGSFVEPELRVSVLQEEVRNRQIIGGAFDAVFNGPVPVGIGLTAEFSKENDSRGRPDIDFFTSRDGGETIDIEAFVGVEAGPFDQFAFQAAYRDLETRANSIQFTQLDPDSEGELKELAREKDRYVFGMWSHEFGYRSRSTLAFGTGTINQTTELYDLNGFFQNDFANSAAIDFTFASASYARSFGFLDLKLGGEYADLASDDRRYFFNRADPATRDPASGLNTGIEVDDVKLFFDARLRATDWLILQGQARYVRFGIDVETPGGTVQESRTNFDWRAAAAVEPVPGQWLRVAAIRQSNSLFPLTIAPVNTIGLKGNIAPTEPLSRSTSYVARWDAQWSDRFFTSVEYQDQRHGVVEYEIPDLTVDITGSPVDVNRLNIEANYWAGQNVGLRVSYAYTDSAIRGFFESGATTSQALGGGFGCGTQDSQFFGLCQYLPGQQLPFVPKHIGRASVVWSAPAPTRLRATLTGNVISGQNDDINAPVEDAATLDLRLEWEPWDRRLTFGLSALNLLDESYNSAAGVPAPRLTIVASAGLRF